MTVYVLTQNEHGPNAGFVVGVYSSTVDAKERAESEARKAGAEFSWAPDEQPCVLSNGIDFWVVEEHELQP